DSLEDAGHFPGPPALRRPVARQGFPLPGEPFRYPAQPGRQPDLPGPPGIDGASRRAGFAAPIRCGGLSGPAALLECPLQLRLQERLAVHLDEDLVADDNAAALQLAIPADQEVVAVDARFPHQTDHLIGPAIAVSRGTMSLRPAPQAGRLFGLSPAPTPNLGEGQTSENGAFGVPDPAVAGSATQDYRGGPPSGTPPGRVRVALVPGPGPVAADDLYRLLRRRLLVVCTIVACLFFAVVSGSLLQAFTSSDPEVRTDLPGWFRRFWRQLLLMATASALTAVLWRRPPRTVRGLRLVELVVVGVMALVTLYGSVGPFFWGFLEEAGQQPSPRGRSAYMLCYVGNVSLQWLLILTLYGTFIPNTWRRCAAVVA